MQRVPEQPIRLAPEQEACNHAQVRWNGYRGVFSCVECGAQLVIPELEETLFLDVASESLVFEQ